MSSLSDYAKAILAGGLPSVLDLGSAARGQQGDTRPEQTAPSGTLVDRGISTSRGSFILTPAGIAIAVGGTLLAGLILFASIKVLSR